MWISPFVVTHDAISNLVPLGLLSSFQHEDDYVDWRIQSLIAVLVYFSTYITVLICILEGMNYFT